MIRGIEPDAAAGTKAEAAISTSPETAPDAARVPVRWWIAAVLVLLAGFGLLLWQVESHGPVTHFDVRVRDRFLGWSASAHWFFHPARAMADLGNQEVSPIVLVAVTALVVRRVRSWRPAVVTAAALAALATVIPLKIWIGRPGPGASALGDAAFGFFPSGHTADAMLCYGTSAMLVVLFAVPAANDTSRARIVRRLISAVAVLFVLLTMFGLLWSDFHWLSDLGGSLCWCGAALIGLYLLARRLALPAEPVGR
ncbi:MAG: phosphatase PAP2 family protein [Actinocrinis sp.]